MPEGEYSVPSEEPLTWQRIETDDPVYKELIEKNKSVVTRHLFGLQELNTLKNIQDELEKNPEDGLFYKSVANSFLRTSLLELQKISYIDKGIGLENLIYEVMDDDEDVKKNLIQIFPDCFLKTEEMGLMIVNSYEISNNIEKIPLNLYKNILEIHVRNHQKHEKEITEKHLEMQAKLIKKIEDGISAGIFPLDIKKVKEKLSKIKVVAGDFLLYSDFNSQDGDYDPDNETAVLPTGEVSIVREDDLDFEHYQEYVYTHEMMHALSGIAVLGGKKNGEDFSETRLQRLGMRIEGKFTWLNEAITEYLTLKIFNKEDSNAYNNERRILQTMINKGVPESLFINAYFENQEPGKGSPAIKKLIKTINEKCGTRFLQIIDDSVDLYGLGLMADELTRENEK